MFSGCKRNYKQTLTPILVYDLLIYKENNRLPFSCPECNELRSHHSISRTKILKTKQKLKNQHFLDPSEKLSHRLSHYHPNWGEK